METPLYMSSPLISPGERLLVGVSGGVDSVVLFHFLLHEGHKFSVAHCNFHLREGDCDEDEKFVKDLCEKNKIPFFVKHFDTKKEAESRKKSIELTARELRYEFFYEVCQKEKIEKLVLAHHASDNFETALYNLTKGTSIAGVRGIPSVADWKDKKIIRPLFCLTKEEIIDYARKKSLQWREDYTNQENVYARNLIRNEVVPLLKKINPSVEKSFIDTSERLCQIEEFWNFHLRFIKTNFFHQDDEFLKIDILSVKQYPWGATMLWDLLKEYDFSFDQIQDLLYDGEEINRKIENKYYRIYDVGEQWILYKRKTTLPARKILPRNKWIMWGSLVLTQELIEIENYKIDKDPCVAAFDADKVKFPLTLRPWKEGDWFYPIGKKRFKKNVSDLLNEKKIALPLRENAAVLLDANNEIIWVVGVRMSDTVKITEETKKVLLWRA